jgi:predicted DNA binding CopG/RHH family protein
MKNTINYKDEPIEARVIEDFLPKPEELVLKEKQVKVTLTLTEKSVDFFKRSAKKHRVAYQAMIRKLLDYYVTSQ